MYVTVMKLQADFTSWPFLTFFSSFLELSALDSLKDLSKKITNKIFMYNKRYSLKHKIIQYVLFHFYNFKILLINFDQMLFYYSIVILIPLPVAPINRRFTPVRITFRSSEMFQMAEELIVSCVYLYRQFDGVR